MKQKFISILLIISFLLATFGANAVSIEFENLEQNEDTLNIENENVFINEEDIDADEILQKEIIQDELVQNKENILPDKIKNYIENDFLKNNVSNYKSISNISTFSNNSLNNYTIRDYINVATFASIGGSPSYTRDSDYDTLNLKDSNNATFETWNKSYDCGYVSGTGTNGASRNNQRQGNCPNFIQNKYGMGNVVTMFSNVLLYKGEKIQIPMQGKGCNICNPQVQIRFWLHKDGLNLSDGNSNIIDESQQYNNNNIFGTLYNNVYYGQTKGFDFTYTYSLTNNTVEFEVPSTGYYTLESRSRVYASLCGNNTGTFQKHGVSTGGRITILSPTRYIYYRYQNADGTYPAYSIQTYENTREDKTYNQVETAEWFGGSVTNNLDTFNSTKVGDGTGIYDVDNVYYNIDGGISYLSIARKYYTVTLNKGTGISSVVGNGTYYCGASVTINATLLNGYKWSKWTGTHNINTQNYTFIMPASNVINTANATTNSYTLTVIPNGGIWNNKTTNSTFSLNYKQTKTIANPTRTGYSFKNWTLSGADSTLNNSTFTMGTSNSTLTANYIINQYPVTYIDVVNSVNGKELGRTTKQINFNTNVRGSDLGNSTVDNAYYNGYHYVSDTSATVTTNGATVYRIFKTKNIEKTVYIVWDDNNNLNGFRPDKYKLKLKQNGVVINEVELSSNTTTYTFRDIPKYDSSGDEYTYAFGAIQDSDRYNIEINENKIIFRYKPTNFSVTIPKKITLNGNVGKANYTVSVNGTFYYNDTLTVKPNDSFILTDRSNISSMTGYVSQIKTGFTKEDLPSSINGNISIDRTNFAGSWQGSFNFEIKFKMQN